jgi:hypothetical protein
VAETTPRQRSIGFKSGRARSAKPKRREEKKKAQEKFYASFVRSESRSLAATVTAGFVAKCAITPSAAPAARNARQRDGKEKAGPTF